MKRILVIDDDVQMRQMLKQMLERQGYEVVEASDGKQGLALYRQTPTDLIITDIIMPEKEGVEMILELKRDFPDVKIIAISGGARDIDAQCCLAYVESKVSRTFIKPFNREELLEAIQNLLNEAVLSK